MSPPFVEYRQRFRVYKAFTAIDYFFGMMGGVFRNIWLVANGIPLNYLFLFGALGTLIALLSQNFLAKWSDRTNLRYPFLIAAIISTACAFLVVAWWPVITGFLLFLILSTWIGAENYRALIAYNLIALAKDPDLPPAQFNRTLEFSRYRIFGSIGFAIAGPIVGYAIQEINRANGVSLIEGAVGFQVMYTICAIGSLITMAVLSVYMRPYRNIERTIQAIPILTIAVSTAQAPLSTAPKLRNLLKNKIYLGILVPQLIYTLCESLGLSTVDIFFKSMGASLVFLGFRPLIWAMVEVPLFFISSYMGKRFNYTFVLVIGYCFFLIKVVFYYFFLTPELLWVALVLQLLNTFGMTYPTITTTIREQVPEQASFALSILATLGSVASLIGLLIGLAIATWIPTEAGAFHALFLTGLMLICINIGLVIGLNRGITGSKKAAILNT